VALASMALVGSLGGWLLRTLWSSVDRMRQNMTELETRLPDIYARRDDLAAHITSIMDGLRRIEDKLDRKADK
jgi:cell division protein FtsB